MEKSEEAEEKEVSEKAEPNLEGSENKGGWVYPWKVLMKKCGVVALVNEGKTEDLISILGSSVGYIKTFQDPRKRLEYLDTSERPTYHSRTFDRTFEDMIWDMVILEESIFASILGTTILRGGYRYFF